MLFVVWQNPLITIGQNTFIADALRWAGAESVVLSDQNWPQIELGRSGSPAARLYCLHEQSRRPENTSLRSSAPQPAWKDLQAVELGRVVVVSDEIARPSPGLIDAVEQLAHQLHPEVFSIRDPAGVRRTMPRGQTQLFVQARTECAQCVR